MTLSAGKEKNFVCDICGLATTTDWYLEKHKRQQHKPVKYITCEYCDKQFRRKEGRERHIDHKHSDSSANNFTCTDCGKGFIFKSSLYVHMSQIHNTRYNTSRENGKIGGKTDSEPVRKKLKSREYSTRLADAVHERKRPFQCNVCSSAFFEMSKLKRHIEEVHEGNKNGRKIGVKNGKNVKVMKVTKQPDGKLLCQLCKSIFDAMSDVVKHMPSCAKLDSDKGQLISD